MHKRRNPPPIDRHRLVLDAIWQGYNTWEEILAKTKLNDNQLGLIFSELLTQKKVKAEYNHGERRYQLLERRSADLVGMSKKVEPK